MSAQSRGDGTAQPGLVSGVDSDDRLSRQQKDVIQRLFNRACQHIDCLTMIAGQRRGDAERKGSASGAARPSEAYAALKTPRKPNCVGVFGRRGSGKTTVAVKLLDCLAQRYDPGRLDRRQSPNGPRWRVIDQPFDLSYAPHEFPHGLTIAHWLDELLRSDGSHWLAGHASDLGRRRAFERASRSFFRGADGFNRLVRDLAVSAEHYADSAAKEISLRLSLRNDIQNWLDALADFHQVDGFVLAVDDIDLAPSNRHHSLVWSLLDELHQDRLLFVLSADLERLEQRLAEEDMLTRHGAAGAGVAAPGESNQQAAQDLAYKVIPQVDRAELHGWPLDQREHFPPGRPNEQIADLAQNLGFSPVLGWHLPYLLPEWPRGLENVQRELDQMKQDQMKQDQTLQVAVRSSGAPAEAGGAGAARDRREEELLRFLAESSFDFPLARALRKRPLPEWAPSLVWPTSNTSLAATWDLIRLRLDDKDDLVELLPDLRLSPLPLKLERVRWVEVLLDIAFHAGRFSPERLVNRVDWLRDRLATCEVSLDRNDETIYNAVDDAPGALLAALFWLRWPDQTEVGLGRFAVGLWPVLQLITGDRPLWPQALARVAWSIDSLAADIPEDSSDLSEQLLQGRRTVADSQLLPGRTRNLLRLADDLARQPWSRLRELRASVGPVELARLAAILSYAALREQVIVESPDQHRLLDQSELLGRLVARLSGEPDDLLALSEDVIRAEFRQVAELAMADLEALPEPDDDRHDRPSASALRVLLSAPWFLGLDL